jgi:2-polyprenyl-6-methoxyphenol hydroxylase-like FAD-dependent oxidoreductase
MKIDVLVTGAGPVGLAMAAELARYGVSVRIIDKAVQRTDKSKALVKPYARTNGPHGLHTVFSGARFKSPGRQHYGRQ